MIITSQDKKSIYNFENVKSIDVFKCELFITDDILSDAGTCIAKYKTEERAKEVLQEIRNWYSNYELLKITHSASAQQEMAQALIDKGVYWSFTYEMPQE